jgi:hypothetical protein
MNFDPKDFENFEEDLKSLETLGFANKIEQFKGAEKAYLDLRRAFCEDISKIPEIHHFNKYSNTIQPKISQERLQEIKDQLDGMRDQLTKKREGLKSLFSSAILEKIDELATILPQTEKKGNKVVRTAWYAALSDVRMEEPVSRDNSKLFWDESHRIINMITKELGEIETREREKKETELTRKKSTWCRDYLDSEGIISREFSSSITDDAIIQMTIAKIEEKHSKENDLDGGKCYCDAVHDEQRHYHFAEAFWDGERFICYTSSETY